MHRQKSSTFEKSAFQEFLPAPEPVCCATRDLLNTKGVAGDPFFIPQALSFQPLVD